jgi:hypothetical protein
MKDLLLSIFIFGIGFAAVTTLTSRIDAVRPPLPIGYEDEDLNVQGGKLRGYSFGAEGLVADWYWMRALQYMGKKIVENPQGVNIEDLKVLNPRLLYPMLDNAVTLDPRYMPVYSYGASVLPEIDPQAAIKLLEKGVEHNPDEWKLYHYLGYIYWQQKDYPKAAELYDRGSKIAGSPDWMRLMVVNMTTDGGGRETARQVYSRLAEEAQDEKTKTFAETKMMGLDALDDIDALSGVIQSFKNKTGRCAKNSRDILPLLRGVQLPHGRQFRVDRDDNLIDPSGSPYVFEEDKCSVRLDYAKTKVAVNLEK